MTLSHWCTFVMYLFKSATRASLKVRSFSASYLIVNLFCIIIIPYAFSSILSELLGDFAYLTRWSLLSSLSVNNSAIKFFEKKFETSLSLWSFLLWTVTRCCCDHHSKSIHVNLDIIHDTAFNPLEWVCQNYSFLMPFLTVTVLPAEGFSLTGGELNEFIKLLLTFHAF